MNPSLRETAREAARAFLKNESEYRMGYIEAEQPHPLTRRLSQTYASSAEAGVRLLLSVDTEMAQRAEKTLAGPEFAAFSDCVRKTLREGGRVFFSGCGSSGRLCMRLENSWRTGVARIAGKNTPKASDILPMQDRVVSIMTGGDYAVIRAVESFEDSTALGYRQAEEWSLSPKDLLVGVTATAETTSILGTAQNALERGASVYMLVCSDPVPLTGKMERARRIYTHPDCRVLLLPCGPMALTGSTRMQSSTFEQLAGAAALETALSDLAAAWGGEAGPHGAAWYGQQFVSLIRQLASPQCVGLIAGATEQEESVYRAGSVITMFAEEYMLDVLTDTTERPPTFMTPPFTSLDMKDQPLSWAYAQNPSCDTGEAWRRCFGRPPRCIAWTAEDYASLGLGKQQIERIPAIDEKALLRFPIGNVSLPEREEKPGSLAMWVGADAPPESFMRSAARYAARSSFTMAQGGLSLPATLMDLYEHLAMKLMLNTLSTGVMARMGRIDGNWMTCLAMSNKKLIDRSARIVSDVCGVPYEQALEECFYSKARIEEEGLLLSPAQDAIRRLGTNGSNTGNQKKS